MLDIDNNNRRQEVRRVMKAVEGALGAWEKVPASEALGLLQERCVLKYVYKLFSIIKVNHHYIYFGKQLNI